MEYLITQRIEKDLHEIMGEHKFEVNNEETRLILKRQVAGYLSTVFEEECMKTIDVNVIDVGKGELLVDISSKSIIIGGILNACMP